MSVTFVTKTLAQPPFSSSSLSLFTGTSTKALPPPSLPTLPSNPFSRIFPLFLHPAAPRRLHRVSEKSDLCVFLARSLPFNVFKVPKKHSRSSFANSSRGSILFSRFLPFFPPYSIPGLRLTLRIMASYDHNLSPLSSPDRMPTPPPHALQSSIGSSHFSHGDLSTYSTEFFNDVLGLQAPTVGPSATLPMPAWSLMPPSLTAEEQEAVEDPFANEDENDGHGDDMLSVEDDEEDELVDDSQVPPPARRVSKRALHPQAPIQPIRYPPPPAEEQLGGGYPRREATPPTDPPATRLRPNIVPPRRADEEARKPRRTQLVNESVDRHRERSVDASRAHLNHSWAGFQYPFTNLPPPPQPPQPPSPPPPPPPSAFSVQFSAPPVGFVPPLVGFVPPSANAAGPFSYPPPEPPSTPPTRPQRPRAKPAHRKARMDAEAAPSTSGGARKLVSHRAMSDEPSAWPVAQAGAESTPKSSRRAPSVDYQPPPPHSAVYQPIMLPPPPAGYAPPIAPPTARRPPSAPLPPVIEDLEPGEELPIPPSPPPIAQPAAPPTADHLPSAPLPPVVEDLELGEELPVPPPPPSDYDEDHLEKDIGCQPTSAQAALLVQFVQVVRKLALAFGAESGLHSDRFLNAVLRSMPKRGARGVNGWNTYEAFARSEEHAVEEYQRIEPTFDPLTMDLPLLSTANLSAMYKKFQETFPDGQAEALLEKYAEWAQLGVDDTLASRQRQFNRICKGLQASIDAANEKDFDAVIFICGACIHEDNELGRVIATPALENAFSRSLTHSTTGLPLQNDDLLAVMKLAAYSGQVEKSLGAGVTLPAALAALQRLETTLMPAAAELMPNKMASATAAKVSTAVAKVVEATKASTAQPPRRPATASAQAGLSTNPSRPPAPVARSSKPSVAGPSKPFASVAGPSRLATAAAEPLSIPAMRDRFCNMSRRCLSYDLFHDNGARANGNFLWVPLGKTLAANDLPIVGYPTNVRLPGEVSRDKGDLVIIGHDYTIAAPESSDHEAIEAYWKTSRGAHVRCADADGHVYTAVVDLRHAGDAGITKQFIKAAIPKKKKVKVEDKDDGEEEEEETEEEVVASKGKGKATAGKVKKTAPAKKKTATTKRKVSSDFEDDDDELEEEEAMSPPPPPKRQKLRSDGPPTPFPPPVPAPRQCPRPHQSPELKSRPRKNRFPSPPPATEPMPPANDPGAVAERRKRMRAVAKQDDGLSGSRGAGTRKETADAAGRDFLLPPKPAAAARSQPSSQPAAAPSPNQPPAQPANVTQIANQIAGQLAHMAPEQLAVFLQMFPPPPPAVIWTDSVPPRPPRRSSRIREGLRMFFFLDSHIALLVRKPVCNCSSEADPYSGHCWVSSPTFIPYLKPILCTLLVTNAPQQHAPWMTLFESFRFHTG
ncbi:hypothetical protein B0H13DRAFT_2437995 [Mycena leptocephala]|nr:hypothetical protein B0H13DRAFT_2437995 [Mycena leptocephala]